MPRWAYSCCWRWSMASPPPSSPPVRTFWSCSCLALSISWSAAISSPPPPSPVGLPTCSCLFCSVSDCTMSFICSSSAMRRRSAGEAATVAFFGCSLMTEAFLAKPSVEKVYLWYVTSGRMAQKRYVRAWSIVSFRYLQRKYELQPGMVLPGFSFFALMASAIFMKNCAISVSDRLIFLPWSWSSLVLRWSLCGPMRSWSTEPSGCVTVR
mmetsp:Transcript_30019/g.95929  ORF Transcript_30019/g.95929 Transcript_30019/m.95929 type:complete len:210 (+) Transcript_30019:1931-2560(+)